MRTNVKYPERPFVSGVFLISSINPSEYSRLKEGVAVAKEFFSTRPWESDGRRCGENVVKQTTSFDMGFSIAFTVQPVRSMRNGQVRAYENRLKEIGRAIKERFTPLSDTEVELTLKVSKGLQI